MKSASFIIAAMMASASATSEAEPKNLWLHPDGVNMASIVINDAKWGGVIFILDQGAEWLSPGGVDLQDIIVKKIKEDGKGPWEGDRTLLFDCRGNWGKSYIEVAGDSTKYCQGQSAGGPPGNYKVTVKAPAPAQPPYHGTATGEPFYEDIRSQELKCLADRNSEWHYDAKTNKGTCTHNKMTPYKPYEPEHDIRAQKQAGVVQKALKK